MLHLHQESQKKERKLVCSTSYYSQVKCKNWERSGIYCVGDLTFGSRHYRTLHEMFPADLEESELFRKSNALELAKQRKAEQS